MARLADLVALVRAPAALSVPGDLVAGAGAAGVLGPATGTLSAASTCLYWAGMAANDWADRDLDAVERPERPIPSGRVHPLAALGLAAGLTAAGLALASAAGGRRSLTVAVPLAATIWAYDLRAKNTPAGPAVMSACRALDVLLGATTQPRIRRASRALRLGSGRAARSERARAGRSAVAWAGRPDSGRSGGSAVDRDGRSDAGDGGRSAVAWAGRPDAGRAGRSAVTSDRRSSAGRGGRPHGAALSAAAGSRGDARTPSLVAALWRALPAASVVAAHTYTVTALSRREVSGARPALPATTLAATGALAAALTTGPVPRPAVVGALTGQYLAGYGVAQARALVSGEAATVRAAVGAGITALPALQGALTARAGSPLAGLLIAAAAPLARLLARKVSPT